MSRHEEKIARHIVSAWRAALAKKRHIVSAITLPCWWCGAESGERCRNSPMDQVKHGIRHVDGLHGTRMRDADLAQHTMEALLDDGG